MFLNQPRLPEEDDTLAEKAILGGAQKQVMLVFGVAAALITI